MSEKFKKYLINRNSLKNKVKTDIYQDNTVVISLKPNAIKRTRPRKKKS